MNSETHDSETTLSFAATMLNKQRKGMNFFTKEVVGVAISKSRDVHMLSTVHTPYISFGCQTTSYQE